MVSEQASEWAKNKCPCSGPTGRGRCRIFEGGGGGSLAMWEGNNVEKSLHRGPTDPHPQDLLLTGKDARHCSFLNQFNWWRLFCVADVVFSVFHLTEQQVVHSITYHSTIIPSTIQLTEDDKCAVTDNVNPNSGPNHDVVMFTIETLDETPQVCVYEFLKGKKYPEYHVTQNIVMKNGLALAIGLNGDMQLWDIPTCEYEGNLCEDPGVKDTRNAGIHTHGGHPVRTAAVSEDGRYLVVGSQDCTASLWDLENELLLYRYIKHQGEVGVQNGLIWMWY